MATCPLCSDILLRHIRSGKPYWLCRRCRLEILEKRELLAKCELAHSSPHPVLPEAAIAWLPTTQYDVAINHTRRQQQPIKTEA